MGRWVALVLSKDLLLKCGTNDDRYSSGGVRYVGILAKNVTLVA